MSDPKRKYRIVLLHIILLPTLLYAFSFFTLAPRSWIGVDEAVIEKVAREHGLEPHSHLVDLGQGDLLHFVFMIAGSVGGFAAGYYWRRLVAEKKEPQDAKPPGAPDA